MLIMYNWKKYNVSSANNLGFEVKLSDKSLVIRCKIRLLLVAEVARCRNSLVTRCKIRSFLVKEVARCKKSLVTRCKIRSLLVAEVARCKDLFVVKNYSFLVAKFDRYLLYKVTKKSQLNLVMEDKIYMNLNLIYWMFYINKNHVLLRTKLQNFLYLC